MKRMGVMNEERIANDNVIQFTQSETKTKTFRHDYPVSDELRNVMVHEVFSDFMKFGLERYYNDFLSISKRFADDHQLKGRKRDELIHNLFWWRILYDSSTTFCNSSIEEYIAENSQRLKKRHFLISWLRECDKAVPKFYHVGHKFNDRVLVVTDLLTRKNHNVIVYDPLAIPAQKGEIVMGTLMPQGNRLYFPIVDFYHFDYDARKEISINLNYYYKKYLETSPMLEAFIHVLSAMLQIERFVHIDNQEKTSSN